MMKTRTFFAAALLEMIPVVTCGVAQAQPANPSNGIAVPAGTCTSAFESQWRGSFRVPVSDGRPGYKFYALGVDALCRHDLAHAIHLFKVAGSWGYKPAEYTLGVMYLRGAGVTADLPLGAAWMELAAASGIPQYVKVRDLVIKLSTPAQLAQMKQRHEQMEPTYGTAALSRARWQWTLAKNAITGSHQGHPMSGVSMEIPSVFGGMQTGMGTPILDLRTLQENDDPYPALDRFLTGSVTVGSLEQLGADGNAKTGSAKPAPIQQPNQGNQHPD
ncbi:MAG: hypothetical protein ACREPZ_08740 [Rhodanobacteraceae bacterium]